MRTVRAQARLAGWMYFLIALTGPVALILIPSRLVVPGNAAATADHLRNSAGLLHAGMACELFGQAAWLFMVFALQRLFRKVDESLANQLLILGAVVSVPIMFVNVLNEVAASTLVSGADYLSVFDRGQLDALAYLFMRLHGQGFAIASIFWGLWLFPFGLLVIRSGFIPKFLGVLLFLAGLAYVGDYAVSLLWPQYGGLSGRVASVLRLGELGIIFWLMIQGATGPRALEPVD
jgi:hypothetical protein